MNDVPETIVTGEADGEPTEEVIELEVVHRLVDIEFRRLEEREEYDQCRRDDNNHPCR